MTEQAAAPQQVEDGLVGVLIDGREVRVAKGTLVLDAATAAGVHIPIYCAHPKMDPVAVCRMCLVQIEKMPKQQPACATVVAEGMVIHTATDAVAKTREGVLEFLLLNHPLDCPVCDRGGECDLQDFAFRYGPETSRFPITDKTHFDKAVVLSDKIELDNERCILCWRCTRYYDEITGEKEMVLLQRGVDTAVGTFNGQPLQSEFQGNLPEICPVGALTHRQYRFKARPWDLQRTKSVCPECSYGCNVNIDSRDFEVKRFASRDNPHVDDMWLCDRGRYSAPSWNDTTRVRRSVIRHKSGDTREVQPAEAITAAATQIKRIVEEHGASSVGVLASPQSTNEELWLLQRIARELIRTPHIDHQLDAFAGLSADEHLLGIEEIEECTAVVVLGAEPEKNAPVLTLRLYKAATKRHVQVRRVAADADAAVLARELQGLAVVGVVADELNRAHAAEVATALARANTAVKRLTITRGVNGRGAKDLGLLPNLLPGYAAAPGAGKTGREILQAAAAGQIKALVLLGGGQLAEAAGELMLNAVRSAEIVLAIETRPGVVADNAGFVIPGHAFVEKAGSVTNVEGRVQRIRQALPPATATPPETSVLMMLAADLGGEDWGPSDPVSVNRMLREALPAYRRAGNGGRALFQVPVA
ncbi:MAG TPA: NADH-quinone oxidoreductase subunit NuoG [Candidatus Angelobacter sp.]|jgi:NADH-quinone oxidoreductase chain G|nr:NADH-quinone oxidoreductase subunit NuoG [Candidatus Angelobacter sp.]